MWDMIKMAERKLLSNELKVASAIYECEQENEKVWFTKLATSMKGDIAPGTILKSLRTLIDFGIVKAQYGETEKGRAGRLLYISGESRQIIKNVYEDFWKKRQ